MTTAINDVWVTVKVELNGKLVSAIYGEWMDNMAVTLSARPFTKEEGFNAAEQAQRFLDKIEFAPFQNIGEPEFEAAVTPATEKLRMVTAEWLALYTKAMEASKLPDATYCQEFPEFDIIITTLMS